jgi:hypothetical protein
MATKQFERGAKVKVPERKGVMRLGSYTTATVIGHTTKGVAIAWVTSIMGEVKIDHDFVPESELEPA